MSGAARFGQVNLIADPLYGYIEITKGAEGVPGERDLLDAAWLQRLRRVHQLQSAWWVFPTAEHSRFAHLLGAMHLSSVFARRIDGSLRAAFPDAPSPACVEETLRLAGLLHDVGHGPFGHFFDHEYLAEYGIDHEDIGRHLILNQLADVIGSLRHSPTAPFEPGEHMDPRWVAWVMAPAELPGYTPPGWLRACKPILCGPATVDNLDYVPRDAYMCGISTGPVDVRRIVHYSFVHGDTLVLHSNASGALEMFLAARLYMYTQVYLHRTGRRFDLSMREVFADSIRELMPGNPLEHWDEYLELTDWSLLEAVRRWRREPEGSTRRRLNAAWERITSRDLPWKLVYETILKRGTDVSGVSDRIRRELPADLHDVVFEVDVASTSIAPENPMTEDGMVAIFDPLQGTVEHSRTRELVARLPQYNQLVRVFTNQADAVHALHAATRAALGGEEAAGGVEAVLAGMESDGLG
jgi:HD superfamily phosphohydrolase